MMTGSQLMDRPSADSAALLDLSWRLFEADDFPAAATAFAMAFDAGADDPDAAQALLQILIDAQDWPQIARLATGYLDRRGPDLGAAEHLSWATWRFDALMATGDAAREDAALALLEAASAAGTAGWEVVLNPSRRQAIEEACTGRDAALALAEQDSYAPPETGLPVLALLRAEALGHTHADDLPFVREVERLLHALGAREPAYRVERARRNAERTPAEARTTTPSEPSVDLRGIVVLVAGGHPSQRRLVAADLRRAGVADVRELPPAWDANRQTRQVRDLLVGTDVAVLVTRQVPHSTSEQVRNAARHLGVPVVAAATASAQAVRRAIEDFFATSAPAL